MTLYCTICPPNDFSEPEKEAAVVYRGESLCWSCFTELERMDEKDEEDPMPPKFPEGDILPLSIPDTKYIAERLKNL